MKKLEVKLMQELLRNIRVICMRNYEKKNGCKNCPANGRGKLCHSGGISCCAPHGWWAYNKEDKD